MGWFKGKGMNRDERNKSRTSEPSSADRHDRIRKEMDQAADKIFDYIQMNLIWENERLQREHKQIINRMVMDYDPFIGTIINQNTMTRQDYIAAIRNGEYCIENDSTEFTILLCREIFPRSFGDPSGHFEYYFKNPKGTGKWDFSNYSKLKSIKASTLANMKLSDYPQSWVLTPESAQRIIDAACNTWKEKLANEWAPYIILNRTINISQSFYQEMRSACTEPQHTLFDEIFGPDVTGIKTGDCIILHGDPTMIWELREDNKLYSLNYGTKIWQQFIPDGKFRHATPEEIRSAQYPPDGTPFWVRDGAEPWSLRYATGNGEFYLQQRKSGESMPYEHIKPFGPNNLPFNT